MSVALCPRCGGRAFVLVVALTADGFVDRPREHPICQTCQTPADRFVWPETPASDVHEPGVADATSRAQHISDLPVGLWGLWRTYADDEASAARSCASALRQGRLVTVARLAGPVESRTVRQPGGGIRVEVRRLMPTLRCVN